MTLKETSRWLQSRCQNRSFTDLWAEKKKIYIIIVIQLGVFVLVTLKTEANIPISTYIPHTQHKFDPLPLVSKATIKILVVSTSHLKFYELF